MGGCLGRRRLHATNLTLQSYAADLLGEVSIGGNQPLKREKLAWKCDAPITEKHLRMRRDEFWDTAPEFEGHREIWDALKAAAYAHETGDYELAQAILDGANISIPTGSLVDCYDEVGVRYQLPVYVLSSPTNLTDSQNAVEPTTTTSSSVQLISQRKHFFRDTSKIPIKLLFSTGYRVIVNVHETSTIMDLKQKLENMEKISPLRCRMFFAGRLLADHTRLRDAKIRKNFTIQVVVSDAPLANVAMTSDPSVRKTAPCY